MAYNAVEMADWQISEAVEENMPYPEEWKNWLWKRTKSCPWEDCASWISLKLSIV